MNSNMYMELEPKKLFYKCAIPAAITSVFGALYSVVDGIFVGKYLGENALAAINLIMPIIMIVEALSNMIATGASVNIAMLLGKKKKEDASKIFSFSVKLIIFLSSIIGLFGFIYAKQFITLISPGATSEAIKLSTKYLKIYSIFGPLIPIYFATDNYLRVCGKQKASMLVGIFTQVLNVILDFVLIVIFHQGVEAAAIASCISIVLGSIYTLYAFAGKKLDIYYTKMNIKTKEFFHIVSNGSSEFFSSIATSIMSVIMNLYLLKYGGTRAVAAFSIVMYVDSIIGMLNFGICDSLQPAISYCYGAGLIDRMKKIFKIVIKATMIISILSFAFMFLAGPHVATIFINKNDIELLKVSITAITIFSFSYLVGWIDTCYSSYFTALDRPIRSLIVSLFGTLIFPITLLFLLTKIWGLNGVWVMSFVAAIMSAILTIILAKTLRIPSH